MVVCDAVFPYKYHKRMSSSQLEYVVFVLVEKYREQNHTDILPTWWPKSVEFCHPMVRDPNEMYLSDWRSILLDVIKGYYKSSVDSWWLRDLLQKIVTDGENNLIHLIRDTTIENNKNKLNEVIETKTNNDIIHSRKQNSKTESSQSQIRIKESALIKLLPQPVVLLCDVVKYGLVTNQENFLSKLNLMKTDKLVNTVRYKFRRRESNSNNIASSVPPRYEQKDKNLPQNGFVAKPTLSIEKKRFAMPSCYVKLLATKTETKKTNAETYKTEAITKKIATKTIKSPTTEEETNTTTKINNFSLTYEVKPSTTHRKAQKSSTSCLPNLKCGIKYSEPPFLILTPCTSYKNLKEN